MKLSPLFIVCFSIVAIAARNSHNEEHKALVKNTVYRNHGLYYGGKRDKSSDDEDKEPGKDSREGSDEESENDSGGDTEKSGSDLQQGSDNKFEKGSNSDSADNDQEDSKEDSNKESKEDSNKDCDNGPEGESRTDLKQNSNDKSGKESKKNHSGGSGNKLGADFEFISNGENGPNGSSFGTIDSITSFENNIGGAISVLLENGLESLDGGNSIIADNNVFGCAIHLWYNISRKFAKLMRRPPNSLIDHNITLQLDREVIFRTTIKRNQITCSSKGNSLGNQRGYSYRSRVINMEDPLPHTKRHSRHSPNQHENKRNKYGSDNKREHHGTRHSHEYNRNKRYGHTDSRHRNNENHEELKRAHDYENRRYNEEPEHKGSAKRFGHHDQRHDRRSSSKI